MSTNDKEKEKENTRDTQDQHQKVKKIFATRTAFGILAITLAASLSPIPSVLAQAPQEGEEGPDQMTTGSLTDQLDASRRLSILGALGISLIEDVKVTSISLNEDATAITVTLSRADNMTTGALLNATNEIDTTIATSPAVTVAAFRTQLDLVNLIQAHMGKGHEMPMYSNHGFGQGNMMMQDQNPGGMTERDGRGEMSMFDLMSFIEHLEIGSNIEEEGWTSPIEVTIPIISGEEGMGATSDNTATAGPSGNSDTEVVVVVVIPYTGGAETTGQVIDQQPSTNGTVE